MKSDSEIQSHVIKELRWDPSITHEHIGVVVNEGIVTLTGNVPTLTEKSSAEKAVQRIEGVRAVVDNIRVRLPGVHLRDDQDIAKNIISQFEWDVHVPDESVKVRVEDGWVELTGEVEWNFQKTAAEDCVREVTGVRGVTNRITLAEKRIDAEQIKKRIEEALMRKAEREARRISVEVDGSRVILSGQARTLRDIEDARGVAYGTPGVRSVENNIHIR